MKNYEKYADEIKKCDGSDFCRDFVKPYILKSRSCSNTSCDQCKMLQIIWLMEEYKEPEVDWGKVKVDTPLLVRKYKNGEWSKRYFAKYEDGKVYAWCNGRTSWNETSMYAWNYAKLAEDEEERKEPEVDWSEVEVGTPILVKHDECDKWSYRYFAKYENGVVYAWHCGCTGWAKDCTVGWEYAKLAESEESK